MATPSKYTDAYIIQCVESGTNNEYSVISIESIGKMNFQTQKRQKKQMRVKHNRCGHIYRTDIYAFCAESKRRCPICRNTENIEESIPESLLSRHYLPHKIESKSKNIEEIMENFLMKFSDIFYVTDFLKRCGVEKIDEEKFLSFMEEHRKM